MDSPPFKPIFKKTEVSSPILQVVVGLSALKDDQWYPSGTGVIIGPSLGMTAKHVFEGYWKDLEFSSITKKRELVPSFSILAIQIINGGKAFIEWDVLKVWTSPSTDIAFFTLSPRDESGIQFKWISAMLDLQPPQVGDRLAGFGFHSSEIAAIDNDESKGFVRSDVPTTSIGEVLEVYPIQRDSGHLSFPCFRTNAKYDPGMSGGPLFKNGKVCGIISAGMTSKSEDDECISYGAMLWPSMATEINIAFPLFKETRYYPVLELAKTNYLMANGHDEIFISRDSNNSITQVIRVSKSQIKESGFGT